MSATLSPSESCTTIYNDYNYNENLVQNFFAERLELLEDKYIKLINPSTNQTHVVKFTDIHKLINKYISIDLTELKISHLFIYINQNLQCWFSNIVGINQIKLMHLGKQYTYVSSQLLLELKLNLNPCMHLFLNPHMPCVNIPIESLLENKASATYFETVVKSIKLLKRNGNSSVDQGQKLTQCQSADNKLKPRKSSISSKPLFSKVSQKFRSRLRSV